MLIGGGTHPPARNYAVGTGVNTLISTYPRNIHNTITSNHFTRMMQPHLMDLIIIRESVFQHQ